MDDNEINLKDKKSKPADEKKSWLMWMLAVVMVLLLATMGFLGWQLKAVSDEKTKLQKKVQQVEAELRELKGNAEGPEEAAEAEEEVACNDTPSEALKENIKAALDSKNTAAFATYFSDPVKFVLAASEKGGNETPDEAAVSMEYANTATGPWDFALPAPTIAAYDAGFYTDYFDANTYVGRAASGQVAAFDFDCNGKINQAFLAAHEDLL
jgi:cytoskeletal protein RodZ